MFTEKSPKTLRERTKLTLGPNQTSWRLNEAVSLSYDPTLQVRGLPTAIEFSA